MSGKTVNPLKIDYPILAKNPTELSHEDIHEYVTQIQNEILSSFENDPKISHLLMHLISLIIRVEIVNENSCHKRLKKAFEGLSSIIDEAAREQVEHHLAELNKRHNETLEFMGKRLQRIEDWQDDFDSDPTLQAQ